MKYSIVLSTHQTSFGAVAFKGGVADNIRLAAQAGYDGVELAVRDASLVDAGEMRRAAEAEGVVISAIGTGQMWGEEHLSLSAEDPQIRDLAVERIRRHVELAAELDAVVIIGLVRGAKPETADHEIAAGWMTENLRRVSESAEKAGVRIAVEAINRYETDYVNTAEQGLELIDRVSSPSLGILLDTFHMNIEERDLAKSIRQMGDRLFHFHVADSNRRYPGNGHIDFTEIFRTLREIGYGGFVSGEFLPLPDGPESIRKGLAHLKECEGKITTEAAT